MSHDVPPHRDGRRLPAVFIFGAASTQWLDELRAGLPQGVDCYFENDLASPPLPGRVESARDTGASTPTPTLALQGEGAGRVASKLCEADPGRDWIILKAGLELPDYWFGRLRKAAQSQPTLGVIQALSNAHPKVSPLPADFGGAELPNTARLDGLVYCLGTRSWFDTNELHPACVWLAAGAIQALTDGSNSEDPNAILNRAGWRVAVLDHLYVHDPESCAQTTPANYTPDLLATLQRRIAEALASNPEVKLQPAGLDPLPVLLHVTHSWGGGVERFIHDLIDADCGRRHLVLAAVGESDGHSYGRAVRLYAGRQDGPLLREWRLPQAVHSVEAHASAYKDILNEIITDFAVDQVLISSLIGHSLEVLETGLQTAVVLHDYFPVCPALNIYFDEVCSSCKQDRLRRCLKENPYNQLFVDKDVTGWLALRDAYVTRILQHQPTLVVPTDTVREHMVRIEPRLEDARFTCIPHGLSAWLADEPATQPTRKRDKLQLVLLGRLKPGKGRELLHKALPELRRYADIWLVGCGKEAREFLGQSGVHLIFDYERQRLPEIVNRIQPDAGLLLSTVPETFGYTLSELWSLNVPVIATNRGAYKERVRHEHNGLLVANQSASLVEAVARIAADTALLKQLQTGAAETQVTRMDAMVENYSRVLPPPQSEACRYTLKAPTPNVLVENALRETLARTRDGLDAAQAQIDEHQRDLLERASWGFRLQKQLDTSKRALEQRATQVVELEDTVQERTRWAQRLDEELNKTRLQAQGVERDLNSLRDKHQAIVTSRSWRWTLPLRVVTIRLRRLRDYGRFQLGRFRSHSVRTHQSLSSRGVRGTVARIGRERQGKPDTVKPTIAFELPAPGPLVVPGSEHPRASIIIPAFNNSALTFACLYSIAKHVGTIPFEVVVVDDASSDNTREVLQQVKGIRVEHCDANAGFIHACNRGAELARGEYLVFLNNDTQVTERWLESLLSTFEQQPEAGLAGAKLVYPDGRLQEAGGIVFSDGCGWNYGRNDDAGKPEYNFLREVDYCSGACIAIGKAFFDQLGGFDTHYQPAYYEDTDLAFKIRAAGKRVFYQPASTVIHFEGATSGTDTAQGTKRYQVTNQKKFLERWRKVLATHPAPDPDIALARQHRVKGRVLIVDAVTPQPDQDSGSLRMVNLIALLQSLDMSVSFIPANLMALEPYTSQLQQQGVEMLHLPWLHSPTSWFAENGYRFGTVVLSRHYVARDFIWLVRRHCPNARILFDTVDLHFLRAQRLAELSPTATLNKAAQRTRKEELEIARQADTTLVVSPYEQKVLSEVAPDLDVKVLSNIHHVSGRRKAFSQRKDLWFVGGFQHPPNIDAMRWFVGDIWPLIRAELPGVEFHIVGSKLVPEVKALADEKIHVRGHVPDVEPFLDGCRLSVAPLRYGAGVKGKVNQSMAYGQPVVATPAAVEGMYAKAGEDVLVADNAQGFAHAVIRLYQDEALWSRLSENGLENVRRYFSFDAARAALVEILELDGRDKPRNKEAL